MKSISGLGPSPRAEALNHCDYLANRKVPLLQHVLDKMGVYGSTLLEDDNLGSFV